MSALAFIQLAAGFSAVIAACVTGSFTYRNTTRLNEQSQQSSDFQGAISRDLEHLKVRMDHGRSINSAQWDAEFGAYQALWASFVPLRGTAQKLTTRDEGMENLGLAEGDVSPSAKVHSLESLLHRYAKESTACMIAINSHAPFYEAEIRSRANRAHELAYKIFEVHTAGLVKFKKNLQAGVTEQPVPTGAMPAWKAFVAEIDRLEESIRERMKDVRVIR